nr:histidinol dehydrogenase [Kineosphaera limosa]
MPRLNAVISRLDLRGHRLSRADLRDSLPRAEFDMDDALGVVAPICAQVRERGAAAIAELSEQFDGVRPAHLRVPAAVLAAATDQLDPIVRAALVEAIDRTRTVHTAQLPAEHTTTLGPGARVTQRWLPTARVGLYVPGGLAVYPSSVVMNVVPAQVAGVGSIAVTSPPQRDNTGVFAGYPHPTILAACALLGVQEVYAVGGAQAIAMLAYGVRDADVDCPPVNIITGPGNIFVASAKRHLRGVVGIDAEAGPTEIAILADETADPDHVAADLVSQAEHDPLAAAVLVTDSEPLARAVEAALARWVGATKHAERVTTALAGRQSAVVLVDDLDAGLAVVDAYAAEHLEIHTRDAAQVARRVTNAGAIFVGTYSPVSLGDYSAGSNHVLPTAGTAAHSGGLSVHAFLRGVQLIEYDEQALGQVADGVVALARDEDLPAHGDAILARVGGAAAMAGVGGGAGASRAAGSVGAGSVGAGSVGAGSDVTS